MIHTKDLQKIISLALCSAYVKGDKPLSLLIISDRPESGKTEIVKGFLGTPRVEFATDISGYGIKRDLCKRIMEGNLYHIIIPEFLQPLSKGKISAQSFTTTLQAIMEDGVMGLHTGFLRATSSVNLDDIKSVGVIACMPRPSYTMQLRNEWVKSGFLSRWLVVSYKYNDDTIKTIFESINKGEYLDHNTNLLELGMHKFTITIPQDVANKCYQLSMDITVEARKQGAAYGFRELKHIRSLVAACAVYDKVVNKVNRDAVTINDFNEIDRLGYLFNEQFNAVKQ